MVVMQWSRLAIISSRPIRSTERFTDADAFFRPDDFRNTGLKTAFDIAALPPLFAQPPKAFGANGLDEGGEKARKRRGKAASIFERRGHKFSVSHRRPPLVGVGLQLLR
jgi:hypothetical protein